MGRDDRRLGVRLRDRLRAPRPGSLRVRGSASAEVRRDRVHPGAALRGRRRRAAHGRLPVVRAWPLAVDDSQCVQLVPRDDAVRRGSPQRQERYAGGHSLQATSRTTSATPAIPTTARRAPCGSSSRASVTWWRTPPGPTNSRSRSRALPKRSMSERHARPRAPDPAESSPPMTERRARGLQIAMLLTTMFNVLALLLFVRGTPVVFTSTLAPG